MLQTRNEKERKHSKLIVKIHFSLKLCLDNFLEFLIRFLRVWSQRFPKFKSKWKIIWWNFGDLAVRLGGISHYWVKMANFETKGSGKLHKHVTLWVEEIIRCEKRENLPTEVLYKVQKCFSPGGPNIGSSPSYVFMKFTTSLGFKIGHIHSIMWNSP